MLCEVLGLSETAPPSKEKQIFATNAQPIAMRRLEAGPAMATKAMSLFGRLRLVQLTGTGFAQPKMKGLMLESQKAMLEAGLPKKLKRDEDIPHYYGCDSWRKQCDVPWNEAEKRALTPAEGIQILVAERDEAKRKATEATKKLREKN